jgi:ATP-dependent RNA helicase DeaD
MGDGGVWFRASIGSRKNAEARWLLPMICRRGGIDKTDIGAIRVMDTTTEFEISARAAESFAAMIRRPDKEDNIRIEALPEGPQGEPAAEKRPPAREREERAPRPHGKPWQDKPRDDNSRDAKPRDDKPWSNKPPGGKSRDSKPYEPRSEKAAGFDKERRYDKKRPFREKPAYAAKPKHEGAAKPAFGKKKKKKFRD